MAVRTPTSAPLNPCSSCRFAPDCETRVVLDAAIYSKPSFRTPTTATFLKSRLPTEAGRREFVDLLEEAVAAWTQTASSLADPDLVKLAFPAAFDFLMSGLYAWWLHPDDQPGLRKSAYIHQETESDETLAFYPNVWMCPACVAEAKPLTAAYLPGYRIEGRRYFASQPRLSRPDGRLIGDFGALVVRAIVETAVRSRVIPPPHFAAGGGHRGEFDLLISTADLLILGEIKASPLVVFPLVATTEGVQHHSWSETIPAAHDWSFYVASAPSAPARVPLSDPAGNLWPLPDLVRIAEDAAHVETILAAWGRHLAGYRQWGEHQADKLLPEEPADVRWHRHGCGNFEVPVDGHRVQFRVDNTKSLPGLDRTDDIKKGTAQILLFDRLKRGCQRHAVKSVLFGNLFPETHHLHYLQPFHNLQISWPGEEPLNLFDGIVGLSRNIFNDAATEVLFGLASDPYTSTDEGSILVALDPGDDEDGE